VPPAEVVLITPRASQVTQVLLVLLILLLCGIGALAVLVEPWWAAVLWAAVSAALVRLAIGGFTKARHTARVVAALRAHGKPMRAHVLDITVTDDGEGDVDYELKLRIADGFDVLHGCHHDSCNKSAPGDEVTVLVDPVNRVWGVVH
jgi:hypothetical protein